MSEHNNNGSRTSIGVYGLLVTTAIVAWWLAGGAAQALNWVFFAATLSGVALFHKVKVILAVVGMLTVASYNSMYMGVDLLHHLTEINPNTDTSEARILANICGLLLGFPFMAAVFGLSGVEGVLPRYLPDDWRGPRRLGNIVFWLSMVLDNIAAALIGGKASKKLFRGRVRNSYVSGLTAASNAGGSFSPIGDTTTTMLWLAGTSPLTLFGAIFGAVPAYAFLANTTAKEQQKFEPIQRSADTGAKLVWRPLIGVASCIAGVITTNLALDLPVVGLAIGLVICWGLLGRGMPWVDVNEESRERTLILVDGLRSAFFLGSLIFAASLMPVHSLPDPSASLYLAIGMCFILGVVSAGFDNIPLTALAIAQGGYPPALLAFAVGYGGSMMSFGSSAGVAITQKSYFPEAAGLKAWVVEGWRVPVSYVLGFVCLAAYELAPPWLEAIMWVGMGGYLLFSLVRFLLTLKDPNGRQRQSAAKA